ncbi:MAG: hypothetical protein V9F01_09555 [Chitinophagaceae bacterium]
MKKNKPDFLQQNKELLNRVESQGDFIRTFEKEVYENVNQVLCLAKIKLAGLDFNDKVTSVEKLEESGNLIGKAISDLRNLAKQVKNLNNSPVKTTT